MRLPMIEPTHARLHLHVLRTDGGLRRDGAFVPLPEPDAAMLEGLWRRTVLAAFVRQGWLGEAAAARMLAWPHPGLGAYVGASRGTPDGGAGVPGAEAGPRAGTLRGARALRGGLCDAAPGLVAGARRRSSRS